MKRKKKSIKPADMKKLVIAIIILVVLIVTVAVAVSKANKQDGPVHTVELPDTSDAQISINPTQIPEDILSELPAPTSAASNNVDVYVEQKKLYSDDNITITVKGYVTNQIYGQGLRIEYWNHTGTDITVNIFAGDTFLKEVIVDPYQKNNSTAYLSFLEELFTEINLKFTIGVGEEVYETEEVLVQSR